MKPSVVISLIGMAGVLLNVRGTYAACPAGGRGPATSSVGTTPIGTTLGTLGGTPASTSLASSPQQVYLQQLAYQQYALQQYLQFRQQETAFAQFKQQERDRKTALRRERLAAQEAKRQVTRSYNLNRRNYSGTKMAAK